MATVQKIPLGRKPGQAKIVLPDQVQISLGELAGKVKQGLLAFSVGVGLEVFRTLLDEDVTTIVGERGKWNPDRSAHRHGAEPSSVVLGGRKVAVERPRVRSVADEEIALPTWGAFSGDDLLDEMAFDRIVAGLSTRNYQAGLEPVGDVDAKGTSKSAVSRRFEARTRAALSELMNKDLSELDIYAIVADGEDVGDHTVVVALGIDRQGQKHPLGLREGSTENEAVCTALFRDLVERGLDFSGGILLVIDGGKGLRAAVRKVFGPLGLVQRCRLHKERNILRHLPDHMKAGIRRKIRRAWSERDPDKALAQLQQLAHFLEDRHPGAASSLREGMEETLTITKLGIPPGLTKTLFSTNTVESMISVGRTTMRNVKRWRNGKMVCRWVAAGMEVAAKQFRKVKGYKEIPVLIEALAAHAKEVSHQADRVVA